MEKEKMAKKKQRTTDELRKSLKEQSKCFKILYQKLEDKNEKINKLKKENSILKYDIKCLEKEVFRLKYDKRRNVKSFKR